MTPRRPQASRHILALRDVPTAVVGVRNKVVQDFEKRKKRFIELIEEELLRRGFDPKEIRDANYRIPPKRVPQTDSVIDAEFVEVQPTVRKRKREPSLGWTEILCFGLACTTTGALIGALIVG